MEKALFSNDDYSVLSANDLPEESVINALIMNQKILLTTYLKMLNKHRGIELTIGFVNFRPTN